MDPRAALHDDDQLGGGALLDRGDRRADLLAGRVAEERVHGVDGRPVGMEMQWPRGRARIRGARTSRPTRGGVRVVSRGEPPRRAAVAPSRAWKLPAIAGLMDR